jgi:hypothetical protein
MIFTRFCVLDMDQVLVVTYHASIYVFLSKITLILSKKKKNQCREKKEIVNLKTYFGGIKLNCQKHIQLSLFLCLFT